MAERASEQSIFLDAIGLDTPAARGAYLDEACRDHPGLRAELDALLAAHDRLGGGPPPAGSEAPAPEAVGAVLPGRYKLVEAIGEGGMGTVWLARQTEPVKRQVAVKLIKPGMDSKQVLARFDAERQALALMDHPNIARVHDAGTTPSGRPFFVMELVKGVPLTRFCDEHRLTPRQRLELFVPVCQAIQHAHQKGVIHRDLKPSNVLVACYDNRPVPKVIDFGVAKAVDQPLTEQSLNTGFGAVVGTVEYMSPEQASFNALDVDTRSDVYALGVLLYELLTGGPPFDRSELKPAGMLEMLRVIREQEPTRPSTKLSTAEGLPALAANRGTEPKRLAAQVRGELDWIVMKALQKDRNRRYETASGFALDVQRYLADEPVAAGPPSAWYRLRKFLRRNRRTLLTLVLLGAMALAALAAVAGTVGWAIRDQEARRTRLDQQVAAALEETEAAYRRGDLVEARAALVRGDRLRASGSDNEDHQCRLSRWRKDLDLLDRLEAIRLDRSVIRKDGNFDRRGADRAYREAFARYGLDVEELDPDDAAGKVRDSAVADRLVAALHGWAAAKPGLNFVNAQRQLAVARRADSDPWRGRLRDALARGDVKGLEDLARADDVLAQPPVTLEILADVLEGSDRLPLAVELLEGAQRRQPGDLWINHNLGMKLRQARKASDAEIAGFVRVALARRPGSCGLRNNLGIVLQELGKLSEAEAEFREAVRLKSDYAMARSNLGTMLRLRGRLDEAEKECRLAIGFDPDLPLAYNNLSAVLSEQGREAEAEAASREALRREPDSAEFLLNLGRALQYQGKRRDAIKAYREAIRLQKDYALPHANLGGVLWEQGNFVEAEAECREAIRLDSQIAMAHSNLGNVLKDSGRLPEAIAEYRLALRLDPRTAHAHQGLGSLFAHQGKFAEAEVEYRAALRLRPHFPEAHVGLGAVLGERAAWAEAEAEYRAALRLRPHYPQVHYNLGVIYRLQNMPDRAEQEYRETLRQDPDYVSAHNNLGNLLVNQKKHAAAEVHFREVVRLKPDSYEGHNGLGYSRMMQGKRAEAVAAYRDAIRVGSDRAQAHQMLARLLTTGPAPDPGDAPSALEAALKAVELAPQAELSWRVLGWAQYRSGNWQACLTALNKALTLPSNRKDGDPGIWFVVAMAHRQLGDRDQAEKGYTQAVQWMHEQKATSQEWRHLQREAAALLKIDKPKPDPD